jgi:MFS family permease
MSYVSTGSVNPNTGSVNPNTGSVNPNESNDGENQECDEKDKLVITEVRIDTQDLKPHFPYLFKVMIIGCLGAAHFGTALNLTNACNNILPEVMDWPEDKRSLYLTIVSSTSVAGVSIGSVVGGSLIQYGRRKMYILFCIVSIVGCILSTFPTMWVMCIGRFIYGFGSGILCVAGPRIMNEIIPAHLMDLGFNSSTNIFINIFSMMSMLLGLGSPPDDDIPALRDSNWYKVVYLVPVIFNGFMIFYLFFVHTNESIHFHIVKGEKEEAMKIIRLMYPSYDDKIHELVYEELFDTLIGDGGYKEKLTTKQTLFGAEYRIGSWVCIFVAAANTLAGVNLVNQYAKYIYTTLNSTIESPSISASSCTYIVGVFGFLGSLTALLTVKGLTRRKFFIGGHTLIAISLGLCIFFSAENLTLGFLISHCFMIVSFQGSNGAGFWVYAGEVANEVAMGLCLLVMLAIQLLLSIITPALIEDIQIPKFLTIFVVF